MAESGIVFRYVFNNTEYETYELAKEQAEGTVGGGHVYKRRKNISINQIKHWDYMQNPATYEDWEYVVGDDEDMGFVDYVPPATPCLYFKLVQNTESSQSIGEYTNLRIYTKDESGGFTIENRVDIGASIKIDKDVEFKVAFFNEDTELSSVTGSLKDKSQTPGQVTKKIFSCYSEIQGSWQQLHNLNIRTTPMSPSAREYGKLNDESFTYYVSGSIVEVTDCNYI